MSFQSVRRWLRRQRSIGPILVFLILLLLLYKILYLSISPSPQTPIQTRPPRPLSPLIPKQAAFWRQIYALILHNDPKCEYSPELVVPHKVDVGFDPSHDHPRPDILWMRPHDVKRMQVAHTTFVSDLNKDTPELVYQHGTLGIVMTAGLDQLPVLVISLQMLRRTDCELPVEVFLASDADYDPQVCDLIFPALNARCLLFSDIIHASKTGVALEGYQYKFMALLFSSFQDVLILDLDTFPIRDPSSLFLDGPFNSTGMLLWPDFWYPSESPYFFELTRLGPPPPLNRRPAIESGEMMFSKAKHNTTLLLAAYYNYYGPQYFYPLLSQGAPGQGDKDTFAWAATIMQSNTSFYLVHEPVFALGHVDSNGIFVGSAMAQHDPVQDSERQSSDESRVTSNFGKPNAHPQQNSSHPFPFSTDTNITHHSGPLFIHANFPKFDPATIFTYGDDNTARPIFDSNGTAVRAWVPSQQAIDYFGYDIERAFWAEIQYVACNWEGLFSVWEGRRDICYNVRMYRQTVFTETVQL